MKRSVAVDVDGVLAEYDGWKGFNQIGAPLPGAREFLTELREDYRVLIFTTRGNTLRNWEHIPSDYRESQETAAQFLQECLIEWLQRHELPFDEVYVGPGKPICCAIVDDRAVLCRPQEDPLAFDIALHQIRSFDGMYDRRKKND